MRRLAFEPTFTPMSKAWYGGYKGDLIQATELLAGARERALGKDGQFQAFLAEINSEIPAQFIFESNNIEGEGLPAGETKKLVLEEIAGDFSGLKSQIPGSEFDLLTADQSISPPVSEWRSALKMKGKAKELSAVIGHLAAYLRMDARSKKARYENHAQSVVKPRLLEPNLIKNLHLLLCMGNSNNDNGLPGHYRPRPACIDEKTVFLEPSLIENAMEYFFQNHYSRLSQLSYNPIIEACRVKEEFIKIHPFGDFNGRISRLMVGGFLKSEGYPILLILRSDPKDKKRYFDAMKACFRGNPTRLISLISKAIIRQIEGLNTRLELSGLEKIAPMGISQEGEKRLNLDLQEFERTCKNMLL